MAKVQTGPIISDIRNKLGDVVFFRMRSGLTTRAYVDTPWPATPFQVAYTNAFSDVMGWYQNDLSDTQRRAWESFAQRFPNHTSINGTKPLSPAQAYIRTNLPLWKIAGLRLDDPPLNMDVLQPRSCAILLNAALGNNWQITSSAADNSWRGLAYSPDLELFAAVSITGVGNRVMTSPDGTTWTIRNSAADNDWRSITWSPALSLFAAVASTGAGNRVMTSPDGINWTIRNSAANNYWTGVAWSPALALFAAVALSGLGNRVMTSPDGINWTIRVSAADTNWNAITWSPELALFVAVGSLGTTGYVMTSPDGINWTSQPAIPGYNWRGIAWSPELTLLVAVAGVGPTNHVMTSPDGITWTLRTTPADQNWPAVAWSPALGLFAAVAASGTGHRVMTSPDGITWTLRTSPADNNWNRVAWSPELALFAAIADTGVGNRAMTADGLPALTVTVDPDPTANEVLVLALTEPLPAARLNFVKAYPLVPAPHFGGCVALQWLPGPVSPPFDVYTDWKAFYDARTPPTGTLTKGKRIGLLAYFMNLTNGALSQKVIASSLTT